MRFLIALTLLFSLTSCENSSIDDVMEQFLWQKNIILIFSPYHDQTAFKAQIEALANDREALKAHDFVIWEFIFDDTSTLNGHHKPQLPPRAFFKHFGVDSDVFSVIVLGKDGEEVLRRGEVVGGDEILEFDKLSPIPTPSPSQSTPVTR